MPLETFESLLQKLGEVIGVPDLQADANGDCELLFDDSTRIHVQWEPVEDCVIFSSDIGVVPKGEIRVAILEKLLSANLFWLATRGCTFAIETQTDLVVLQNRARLESLTYETFSQLLEMFVESTEKWTKELEHATATATGGLGLGTCADEAFHMNAETDPADETAPADEGQYDIQMPPQGLRGLV
ncbi:MAG TPA: type III secretion system chaperone [Candidatus Methylacidiphilales bacterium]|nr:type III secretion system chaperone [Candidatus Methylacidiphilales bacterium]